MEQNTFKSLSSRLSFDNIFPAFKAIYQKLRPDLFEQTDWNIYQDIYQDLRTHEADTSQYFILIFERWEDTSCPGSNCCVGYEDGDNYDYRAIGGYPFLSEILGMEITISNGITLTPQEQQSAMVLRSLRKNWRPVCFGKSHTPNVTVWLILIQNILPLNICSHALVLMTSYPISSICIKEMHQTRS